MPVANNTIRQVWYYTDTSDNPLTGMVSPTDVTLTLKADLGNGTGTASETVSWVERGGGFYDIIFTPLSSGFYSLFLRELNVNSNGRLWTFSYEISSAGAAYLPAYANAFCAETDIERWTQTLIDGTTTPNDTQAAGFAQNRANILMSLCSGWGFSVTPQTVTNGSRVQSLLREANAIGAALDYTLAQQLRVSPSVSDRVNLFQAMWDQYVGREGAPGSPMAHIPGYLEIEVRMNLSSLATDQIISGDTIAADSGPVQDVGIQMSMSDLY